jgi:hypothetical protein
LIAPEAYDDGVVVYDPRKGEYLSGGDSLSRASDKKWKFKLGVCDGRNQGWSWSWESGEAMGGRCDQKGSSDGVERQPKTRRKRTREQRKEEKRGLNVGNANDSRDWSPNGIAQCGGLII